jgi:hypothetical protein
MKAPDTMPSKDQNNPIIAVAPLAR